jgi:hypothetical protein
VFNDSLDSANAMRLDPYSGMFITSW